MPTLYRQLCEVSTKLADTLPGNCFIEIDGHESDVCAPPAICDEPLPPEVQDLLENVAHPLLRKIDSDMALVRRAEDEVWETLTLRINGWSGKCFLEINNRMGQGEFITAFVCSLSQEHIFKGWCDSRANSPDLGSPWDLARRQRRVVWMELEKGHFLIDPGCYAIMDVINNFGGGKTYNSCEGHPWGASIAFHYDNVGFARMFSDLGWKVEPSTWGGIVVRMPSVHTVTERDDHWRLALAACHKKFGLNKPTPVPTLSWDKVVA
jgi:hypothetical protein